MSGDAAAGLTGTPFFIVKTIFVLAYASFGLVCFLLCCRDFWRSRVGVAATYNDPALSPLLPALLLPLTGASLLLTRFALAGSGLLLAATAIASILFALRHAAWRSPLTLLPAVAAAVLVLSLVWWRIVPEAVDLRPLAAFVIVLAVLLAGFADPWHRKAPPAVPMAVSLIAGSLLLVDLGAYQPGAPILELLAHHWGAFIGPVLQVKAGLVPFYDIPLQYGVGPTLAIAAFCRGAGCWASTDAIVVVLNLANAMLMLRMALATTQARGWLWQMAVALVVFAALFLWTGFPSEGSGVLAAPSVGGMRFLPITLIAWLLFFGYSNAAIVVLVPAVLWSPEAAAMSLLVFGLCETARIGPLRATLRSVAVLAGSYTALVLLHHAAFGVWLDPAAFAEYVLHVPGPLPIDPLSDTLLLVTVLILGGWLLLRVAPDPCAARQDRTATVLLLSAASYWLGRSHPNNICNLMPFLVLVALRVLDRAASAPPVLAQATSFGLALSAAALTLSPWHEAPYDPRVTTDVLAMVERFRALEPGIERIRAQLANQGGLGIADFGPTFTRHPSETLVWTPMDPSSLWSFVPSDRRQLYIRRSAGRLRRSGWAIFADEAGFLLNDLHAGYTIAQQRTFNVAPAEPGGPPTHYVAVCFDPRPDVVAVPVGPPCPAATP